MMSGAIKRDDIFRGQSFRRNNIYKSVINDDKPFDPTYLLGYGSKQIIFGGNYFANKLPQKAGWIVWNKRRAEWKKNDFADCEMAWTNQDKHAIAYTVVWSGMLKDSEEHGQKRMHPNQKPIKLLQELIKDHSDEGAIVLDCYLGSGSTLIACEDTGRTCYGMELDPGYIDVVIKRWEERTGKKAKVLK